MKIRVLSGEIPLTCFAGIKPRKLSSSTAITMVPESAGAIELTYSSRLPKVEYWGSRVTNFTNERLPSFADCMSNWMRFEPFASGKGTAKFPELSKATPVPLAVTASPGLAEPVTTNVLRLVVITLGRLGKLIGAMLTVKVEVFDTPP